MATALRKRQTVKGLVAHSSTPVLEPIQTTSRSHDVIMRSHDCEESTSEASPPHLQPFESTSHFQEVYVRGPVAEEEITEGPPGRPGRIPSTSFKDVTVKRRQNAEEAIAGAPPPPVERNPASYQDVDGSVIPIGELLGNGITESDIKNLKNGGYYTVNGVAYGLKRKLMQVKGMSEKKAEKVMIEAQKRVSMGITTATEVLRKLEDTIKIKTGVRSLDEMLLGGFECGTITELVGPSRCGKSQICHALAVTCQLPVDQGGAEAKAIYIATNDCFRPERVISIAQHHNLDTAKVLDNIAVSRARGIDHQFKLLVYARALMSEDRYGLLIVDSVTRLYRGTFTGGLGELCERQQHLGKFMRGLKDIADEFKVAVLISNEVVANVSGANAMVSNPVLAAGGHLLAHFCKNRLELKKARGPNRICEVINSPNLANAKAMFAINENGIGDAITD